jgi:hypothetical protein
MVLMMHIDAPNSSGFGMLQVVRDLILGTPWASVPQVSREKNSERHRSTPFAFSFAVLTRHGV